jgi:acyl-CoA thioester hydrolase
VSATQPGRPIQSNPPNQPSRASRPSRVEPHGYLQRFPTRWNDNDQYGHVNNAVYYEAMDTTINTWLIDAGLDPRAGDRIAVCASSSCDYRASLSFPDTMRVVLRAGRVGTTSVTWQLTIHREPRSTGTDGPRSNDLASGDLDSGERAPDAEPVATGRFVHVFVDARTRLPAPIPPALRAAIERDLAG